MLLIGGALCGGREVTVVMMLVLVLTHCVALQILLLPDLMDDDVEKEDDQSLQQ